MPATCSVAVPRSDGAPWHRRRWRRLVWLTGLVAILIVHLAVSPAVHAQDGVSVKPGDGAMIAPGGETVLLRATPGYDAEVIAPLPPSTWVQVSEGPLTASDGSPWYGVATDAGYGYVSVWSLAPGDDSVAGVYTSEASTTAQEPVPVEVSLEATVGSTAVVTSELNLRSGPSTADAVLLVMPGGTSVTITGTSVNGFAPVDYAGTAGWAFEAYLQTSGGTPAPAPAPGGDAGSAVTTTDLNLRAGPSTADAVLAVMPPGAAVTLTGEASNGFLAVVYAGTAGWASAQYLSTDGGVTPAPDPGATPPSSTGTATTTTDLNLRAGPSTSEAVLLVMPAGAPVTLTGEASNGFSGVSYNGTSGWAFSGFLSGSGAAPPASDPGVSAGTARTITSLNLRAGPSLADAILRVMPAGVTVEITGAAQNGFVPVVYNGAAGWASSTYLSTGSSPGGDPAGYLPPAAGGSSVRWPMTGSWYISQGYNGSSHQNNGDQYQYYYSFDLARSDGDTAGATVISPVSGTVRWLDPASGGMSIDIGGGHAVAFFHVTIDGGFAAGDPISQGQYVGTVSGPGGPGYAGFAHIHLSLWETTDGGNWSRVAAPFTGAYAISGQSFPDIGGVNQYRGTEISA